MSRAIHEDYIESLTKYAKILHKSSTGFLNQTSFILSGKGLRFDKEMNSPLSGFNHKAFKERVVGNPIEICM